MRSPGRLAVILLTLWIFTTAATVSDAAAAPAVEEDYVQSLDAADPAGPVQVLFGRHAAIYALARDEPDFTAWLAILQRSLQDKSRVRFSYAVAGQRLTLVEPVP